MKKVNLKRAIPLGIITAVGAFLGARIVVKVPIDVLEFIIAACIIFISLFLLMNKGMGLKEKIMTKKNHATGYVACFLIGLYGGFYGGGFGTMLMFVLILLFGFTFIRSAGTARVIGIFMNLGAVATFLMLGLIDFSFAWIYALIIAIGGWVGATYAVKLGNVWIKKIFLVFAIMMALKLLFF